MSTPSSPSLSNLSASSSFSNAGSASSSSTTNTSSASSSSSSEVPAKRVLLLDALPAIPSDDKLASTYAFSSSFQADGQLKPPSCDFVDGLLCEVSDLLMAYAHFKNKRHLLHGVYDLFFRQNPFHGEFTVFAGLEEVLRYVSHFRFSKQDVDILKKKFPDWDVAFFDWLLSLDASSLKIWSVGEGCIVFPRVPLLRVEGPLAVCQLMESALLVLINYASLIATNAARHRIAVGPHKKLLEFGLRRAQGPDGAMSASRYAYIGGFDGTSNVKASEMFNIDIKGTHAHSFVTSFYSLDDIKSRTLLNKKTNEAEDFVSKVLSYRMQLKRTSTHEGELTAFICYAQSFPNGFVGLLDTFDTLESGIWNFICVALALHDFGYQPGGIRLDSGDLAYLSKECRKIFRLVSEQFQVPFSSMTIVASNDLSEKVLYALKEQTHEIDSFGIGTNLVTCKNQPSLGCEYKLVEVNNQPRMKINSDVDKVTIPGAKEVYRLYNSTGEPLMDMLVQVGSSQPLAGRRILCRHPFDANKRVYVTPAKVENLHSLVWDGELKDKALLLKPSTLAEIRHFVFEQLSTFREDHLRRLNPTPFKLSVSADLFMFIQDLWLSETPIAEIQ